MQDFPTLFHHLSLLSPWIFVILITIILPFSRALVLKLRDKAVDWAADLAGTLIKRIFSLIKRILGIEGVSGKSAWTPAQSLAKAIRDQLAEGLISLSVEMPRPLPVGWHPVSGKASSLAAAAASRNIETPFKAPLQLIDSSLMLDQSKKWQELFQKTIIMPAR